MKMKIEELAIKHDYYCSTSNYYSNDAGANFNNFNDFWAEWHDADIDMNLMFRWDVSKMDESYILNVFFLQQRKGIFFPICVENFEQKDVEKFVEFARKHLKKLKQIWKPLT